MEISQNLKQANLIKESFWFKFYVLTKGWAARLQAGQYILSPSMNIPQIALKMVSGQAKANEKTVTIPEGFTIKQIEARLAKVGLIEEGELINFNLSDLEMPGKMPGILGKMPGILKNEAAGHPAQHLLEGFLFPDTYRFAKDSSVEEIVAKMLDNFEKKLTPDLQAEIEKQGKTIFEIITMASLLEKEVVSREDRQIVSGIFWQRLASNYPLESCATIAYVLGLDKWRYSYDDTRIKSPYNTYLNIGLPAGPICNPGLSAIQAAIYPQKTDYNFFLSAPDGQTIFSQTLEEHNLNKAKYFGH